MTEEKKGELAVRQSIALVRTFKKMKDYILENRDLIGQRELLQLSMETANNRIEISKINSDMISLEKQISDVAGGLTIVTIPVLILFLALQKYYVAGIASAGAKN